MMSDFRQAAIEALKALEEKPKALEDDYDFGRRQMLETCIDIIQDLQPSPSAQPERKRGKWVGADSQCGIGCPFCGAPVDDFCSSIDYIDLRYEPNFCPNCGADMGQKENDNV